MNIKTKTGIGIALAVLIAAVAMAAPAAAYPGDHPLTVYEQDTVTGGLIFIVNESGIKGETYRCLLDHENASKIYYLDLTQDLQLNLPEGATVKTARLYNYYTWSDPGPEITGHDVGVPAEAYIEFSTPSGDLATATCLNPSGCTNVTLDACDSYDPTLCIQCPNPISFDDPDGREVLHYWDIKENYTHKSPSYGWKWRFPGGTIAWDVTDLVTESGIYTAYIENAKPDTADPDERFCSYGFALLVIYEKSCEPTIEYWIAEGMDLLYAYGYYGLTPAMATASATFTGEFSGDAELHTVTSASTTVEKNATVSFNGEDVGTLPSKNKFTVAHDVYNVTGLSNSPNVAEIEDTLADYFEVRNFFLVAEIPPIAADVTITPQTLNLKSNGEWVTAHVGLEGYNVAGATNVCLKYLDCAVLGEHVGDGVFKFNRTEVIECLDTYDFDGDTGNHNLVELFVTGKVDSTPFKGSDTVSVIH